MADRAAGFVPFRGTHDLVLHRPVCPRHARNGVPMIVTRRFFRRSDPHCVARVGQHPTPNDPWDAVGDRRTSVPLRANAESDKGLMVTVRADLLFALAPPQFGSTMAQSDLHALIEQFAAQVQALAKKAALEEVLATLGSQVSAPLKRGPGRPKGSGARNAGAAKSAIKPIRKGTRRSAEDVEAMGATLLSHVKSNPGQRGEQIAAALKSDVGTIRLPMKALIAAKKITTRGQRRGMTYYVAGAAPAGAAKAAQKVRGRSGRK